MNASPLLLLVEDDPMIAEPLVFGLEQEGYRVLHASDGSRCLELLGGEAPDLILLDVMLPGMSGLQVLRLLRQRSPVPVIMVTARGQELDRVMGLESGADDYIIKPFSFRELLARVRATLRRVELDTARDPARPAVVAVGPISFDADAHIARLRGAPLELTEKEFGLLEALITRAGRAVHRHELLDRVWGEGWYGNPRTLDVHIRWLRAKIEDDPAHPRLILTVRGYGYRFAAPEELNYAQPAA